MYLLQIVLQFSSVEMENLKLGFLGTIVVENSPVMLHKPAESLLEIIVDHDFLQCSDDLIKFDVFWCF